MPHEIESGREGNLFAQGVRREWNDTAFEIAGAAIAATGATLVGMAELAGELRWHEPISASTVVETVFFAGLSAACSYVSLKRHKTGGAPQP